ncbi:non-ribosomal peptide synthetase [Algoriphagus sp. 4150]|uniref:non-ribosomal peptide synthetase n=1 Tax=Algoriphagus sp. 4150 TaxID=2817756 RepID=UPI00286CB73B|nr:non-ribosomal peptide synthetase [Algoriphagus sp. 4150]
MWQEVLGVGRVGVTDDFFRIGGDSILSIQVSSRIRKAGYDCQVRDIFECKTISRLVSHMQEESSGGLVVKTEQGILTGSFGLLPVQQWFRSRVLSGEFTNPHHWNQSFLVKVGKLDIDKLEKTLEELCLHHDMLRVRYDRSGPWCQVYQDMHVAPRLKTLDVGSVSEEGLEKVLTDWQSGFNLDGGPLFQAGYLYGYADGSSRLYFAFHHLIVDVVSWRILVEDVKRLYSGEVAGEKGSSYRQWVESVGDYGLHHIAERPYWKDHLEGIPSYGVPEGLGLSSSRVELSESLTSTLLQKASKAYHTEINDLLLTALAYGLRELNGCDVQGLTLEGHGREGIDIGIDHSHTVGWFTSLFPVKLCLGSGIGESIQLIKEHLHMIPNKGVGFGSFATQPGNDYNLSDLAPVSFNYLGQFGKEDKDGFWQIMTGESSGRGMPLENRDHNVININGYVGEGKLVFTVVTRLGRSRTEELGASLESHLKAIIHHCEEKLDREGASYTPSDFKNVEHEGDLSSLPLVKNVARSYDPFPMTDIQKAYLLGRLDTFEIGGVSNHIYHEFTYSAPIDVCRLERVINKVIHNYLELRTVFDIKSLTQRYLDVSCIEPYRVSIDSYECDYREDLLTSLREKLSHYVYDASEYPLFTFCVSRFNDCDILHVSIDLILLDAESRQNLFAEMTRLYKSDAYILKPSGLNFKDYQDYVSYLKYSKWYAADKKYWHDKLENIPLRPDLLLKNDPKRISKPKFAISSRVVEESVWLRFKEKTTRYGISTSAALLALYGYVLSRYSGKKDFLITLTVFNRYSIHPDVNNIWGDFTSTNLFSYKNVKSSIKDHLTRSHQDLWNDLEHGLFNGLEVQRQLQNAHGLDPYQSVSPIVFTGRVGGNNQPAVDIYTPPYFLDQSESVSSRSFKGQTSQAWIDLQAFETGNKFSSIWLYVEQLFDKEFIERLNNDYCYLIEHLAVTGWEGYLPTLSLPASDQAVIEKANDHVQPKVSSTLVDVCLATIHAIPESFAVIDSKGTYSYRQIGEYSQCIGGYLQYYGLSKRNHLIGVLSEKGHLQVVATLGIMLSGSAYLPLHVDWPFGRVDEILEEGSVKTVLVSQSEFTSRIQGSGIELKYKWLIIESIVEVRREVISLKLPQKEDIAYVIFTSGSTGKPKGVTISHHGAVNTIQAVNEGLRVTSIDKILALSELSFDLSVYDLFGTLAAGGTIVFPDQDKTKEPGHWYELIEKHGITVWNTVPQLMQLLVDYLIDLDQDFNILRLVLMSGDWIPVQLPDQIMSMSPATRVISLGGATEGSIWSIWYEIKGTDPLWKSIPYGYAMPNQKMYVLDEFGEHCPMGVMGDIYIGGEGVALGYWNDEVKTKASFILHETLGRLYKTGDLGRWNLAGYIEFEGRKDNQVKLNGYRVELDEISSKLARIEGVEKTLTTIQDNQLVAYLVLNKTNNSVLKNQGTSIRSLRGTDKSDTIISKLEQVGIRKDLFPTYKVAGLDLNEHKYRLRKSYRQFRDEAIELTHEEMAKLLQPIRFKAVAVTEDKTRIDCDTKSDIEVLMALLRPLSAISIKDRVLPKYLYPSAGSTNAIQTYVTLSKDIDNAKLKKGYYYYQPVSHNLSIVGITEERNSQDRLINDVFDIKLTFKLFKPAIEPIYGGQAVNLSWLEVGHILALLEQQVATLRLSAQILVIDREEDDYYHLIDFVVNSVVVPGNEQMNFFMTDNRDRVEMDYLKRVDSGFSSNKGNHEYSPFSQDIAVKLSETNQLLENSQGLIVFNGSHSPLSLMKSGYHAHWLIEQLYNHNIGSCVLGVTPYPGSNYSIAIGKISREDMLLPEIQAKQISVKDYIEKQIGKYLPTYMVPDHYIFLNELPLTSNNKIDYKKLPKVEILHGEFVSPINDIEKVACSIWQELLQLKKVGTTDDFFGIGGNSILATKAASKMSRELGCNIRVADIFKSRCIKTILADIPSTQITDEGVEWVFSV